MEATRRRVATAEAGLRAELSAIRTAMADMRAQAPNLPHVALPGLRPITTGERGRAQRRRRGAVRGEEEETRIEVKE